MFLRLPFQILRDSETKKKQYFYDAALHGVPPKFKWNKLPKIITGNLLEEINAIAFLPKDEYVVVDIDNPDLVYELKELAEDTLIVESDNDTAHLYFKQTPYFKKYFSQPNRETFNKIDLLKGESLVFFPSKGNRTKYTSVTHITPQNFKDLVSPIPNALVDKLIALKSKYEPSSSKKLNKKSTNKTVSKNIINEVFNPEFAEALEQYQETKEFNFLRPVLKALAPEKYKNILKKSNYHPNAIPEGEGINYLQSLVAKLGRDPSVTLKQIETFITIITQELWENPLPKKQLETFLSYLPKQIYKDGTPVIASLAKAKHTKPNKSQKSAESIKDDLVKEEDFHDDIETLSINKTYDLKIKYYYDIKTKAIYDVDLIVVADTYFLVIRELGLILLKTKSIGVLKDKINNYRYIFYLDNKVLAKAVSLNVFKKIITYNATEVIDIVKYSSYPAGFFKEENLLYYNLSVTYPKIREELLIEYRLNNQTPQRDIIKKVSKKLIPVEQIDFKQEVERLKDYSPSLYYLLRNLTADNKKQFQLIYYFIAFIKYKLLTYSYSPIVFQLMGTYGTGKDTLIDILLDYLFDSQIGIYDPDLDVQSSFNSHYITKPIVKVVEVDRVKKIKNQVKKLSGSRTHILNKKGEAQVVVENLLTLFVLTNKAEVVAENVRDRRVVVFSSYKALMLQYTGFNFNTIDEELVRFKEYLKQFPLPSNVRDIYTNSQVWELDITKPALTPNTIVKEIIQDEVDTSISESIEDKILLYKEEIREFLVYGVNEDNLAKFKNILDIFGFWYITKQKGFRIIVPLWKPELIYLPTQTYVKNNPSVRHIREAGLRDYVKISNNKKLFNKGIQYIAFKLDVTPETMMSIEKYEQNVIYDSQV